LAKEMPSLPISDGVVLLLDLAADISRDVATEREMNRLVVEAWKTAQSLGHSGVLLRVSLASTYVGGIEFKELVGSGVTVHGTGLSAPEACYLDKCFSHPKDELPKGFSLHPDSKYVWLQAARGSPTTFTRSTYSISGLEGYVQTLTINENLREAYERQVASNRLHAYVATLSARAEKASDRARVDELMNSMNAALARQRNIEATLASEQRKLAKAQQAQSRLALMSQLFTTVSALAMTSATLGTPLASSTPAAVAQELGKIIDTSSQSISALNQQREQQRVVIRDTDAALRNLGKENGMGTDSASVFLQKLY
jgi:hypothetical protein